MADLAHTSLGLWDELERDAGDSSIRLMSGLLNFGDPNYGAGGPEGTNISNHCPPVQACLPCFLSMLIY